MDLEQAFEIIRGWAATKQFVAAIHVFGSRVSGTHRPDSDLDVAIGLTVTDEGEALDVWMAENGNWQTELGALLPWTIDLDLYHSEAAPLVFKYVAKGGQEIYRITQSPNA